MDIGEVIEHHKLDMRAPPFNLSVANVLTYGQGNRQKVVQHFDTAKHCASEVREERRRRTHTAATVAPTES